MEQKIIFFDIDGTILSPRDHTISDSTKAAIRRTKERGHLTFVNTGRTFSEIDDEIKSVGFDGYVCGCGTCIYHDSSMIFHTKLDRNLRSRIIEDLERFEIDAVMEGNHAIYFGRQIRNPLIEDVYNMYKGLGFNILTWDAPDMTFDKFCIWMDSKSDIQAFCDIYRDRFDFISREDIFIEVVPKGYSKATGIEYLLSYLKLPHENTYAFGDSANDFTMLNYVKHSIGMGNSEDEIKKIVTYITKDVDEGGIAHALQYFEII